MNRSLALAVLILLLAAAPASAGDRVYGVTNTSPPHIVSFDSDSPGTFISDHAITNLTAGDIVFGMDARPRPGADVYLLTRNAGTGRLYTVDPDTGAATLRRTLAADPSDSTNAYASLADTPTGIDFNPTADRLRIVNANGDNMRLNPTTGFVFTDGSINPVSSLAGVAYTNNLPGATITTLYGFTVDDDNLVIINPPNNGTLNIVGPSGVDSSNGLLVGFDIAPSGTAYATHVVGGSDGLYRVDLATGAHSFAGTFVTDLIDITASTADRISVTATTQSVSEQDENATITVARQDPHGADTLAWSAGGGTATAGADYATSSGTVTFADGEVAKSVTVPLIGDTADEPNETFDVSFTFSGSNEGTILAPKQTITIADDDVAAPAPPDRDADGVTDATDNCPNVVNADQADGNGNGVGTACDLAEVPPPQTITTPPVITPPTVTPKPGRCANAQTGTAKDDALLGTSAGDMLKGNAGIDSLFGAAGDDCLVGDAGDDWLSGGDGNDDLKGGAGNDLIYGGNGNDTIDGGTGVNVIKAGAGNDTIKAKNKKRETIDCGPGKDTVTADKTDKLKGCETKKT